MADGLNEVRLFGNVGADPELRMTGNGTAMLKMRLATSQSYLDNNRQRQERTEWHNVVVWGKRAEGLSKIVSKGSKLLIVGELRTSSYEDRDGNKRYKTDVVARNVLLGGSPRHVERDATTQAPPADDGPDPSYYGDGGDDDIPF